MEKIISVSLAQWSGGVGGGGGGREENILDTAERDGQEDTN